MSASSSKTFAPNTYPERAFDLHGLEAFFRNIDWRTIEQRLHETRPLRVAS
jgi:hypothetical protein